MANSDQTNNEIRCRCGNKRTDPIVYQKRNYSFWGWVGLVVGGYSSVPKSIDYICPVCGYVFESTIDPKLMASVRYH